ncbi:MAG: hypothetical protein H0X26_02160 [Alphaproteobacteria bacterium]|nr:hypothetical protein [Alphaproteobacteria bacterium]
MKNKAIIIMINSLLFTVSSAVAMDGENEEFTRGTLLNPQSITEVKESKSLKPIIIKESQPLSGKEALKECLPLSLATLGNEMESPPKDREQASPQISPTTGLQRERKISKTLPFERRRKSSGSLKASTKTLSLPSIIVNASPREEKISPRINISPRKDISPRRDSSRRSESSPRTDTSPRTNISPSRGHEYKNTSLDFSPSPLNEWQPTEKTSQGGSRKYILPMEDQKALAAIMEHITNAAEQKMKEPLQHLSDSSEEAFLRRDGAISPQRDLREAKIVRVESLEREGSRTPQRERNSPKEQKNPSPEVFKK